MIVYKITNKINDKVYIGQTKNSISKRKSAGYSKKSKIYLVLKEYGSYNFIWEILDNTSETAYQLNKIEKYYIELYDSTNPDKGYNIRKGGGRKKFEYVYGNIVEKEAIRIVEMFPKLNLKYAEVLYHLYEHYSW